MPHRFRHPYPGEFKRQMIDLVLIPVKTLDFGRSVNVTAGLPIVRTSVDPGTARDIAWQGIADPAPAVAAGRCCTAPSEAGSGH